MIYALKGRETWPLEPLRCIPRNRNIVASSYVYLSVSSCMYILIALEDCGSYVYWLAQQRTKSQVSCFSSLFGTKVRSSAERKKQLFVKW